jgi:hypothetical protein
MNTKNTESIKGKKPRWIVICLPSRTIELICDTQGEAEACAKRMAEANADETYLVCKSVCDFVARKIVTTPHQEDDSATTEVPLDYYDHAIRYFHKNPSKIRLSWELPVATSFGKLFALLGPSGGTFRTGCPVQVNHALQNGTNTRHSFGNKLDQEILDLNFPLRADEITAADLPKFAVIQRRADEVYGRLHPHVNKKEQEIIEAGYVG